jgi:hypothetical protein
MKYNHKPTIHDMTITAPSSRSRRRGHPSGDLFDDDKLIKGAFDVDPLIDSFAPNLDAIKADVANNIADFTRESLADIAPLFDEDDRRGSPASVLGNQQDYTEIPAVQQSYSEELAKLAPFPTNGPGDIIIDNPVQVSDARLNNRAPETNENSLGFANAPAVKLNVDISAPIVFGANGAPVAPSSAGIGDTGRMPDASIDVAGLTNAGGAVANTQSGGDALYGRPSAGALGFGGATDPGGQFGASQFGAPGQPGTPFGGAQNSGAGVYGGAGGAPGLTANIPPVRFDGRGNFVPNPPQDFQRPLINFPGLTTPAANGASSPNVLAALAERSAALNPAQRIDHMLQAFPGLLQYRNAADRIIALAGGGADLPMLYQTVGLAFRLPGVTLANVATQALGVQTQGGKSAALGVAPADGGIAQEQGGIKGANTDLNSEIRRAPEPRPQSFDEAVSRLRDAAMAPESSWTEDQLRHIAPLLVEKFNDGGPISAENTDFLQRYLQAGPQAGDAGLNTSLNTFFQVEQSGDGQAKLTSVTPEFSQVQHLLLDPKNLGVLQSLFGDRLMLVSVEPPPNVENILTSMKNSGGVQVASAGEFALESVQFAAAMASGMVQQLDTGDWAALAISPVPLLGDAVGLANDIRHFYYEPESRTWTNAALSVAGLIPWVPPGRILRAAMDATGGGKIMSISKAGDDGFSSGGTGKAQKKIPGELLDIGVPKEPDFFHKAPSPNIQRGNLTGDIKSLTEHERSIAEEFLERGIDVHKLPTVPGEKTPDFVIRGVRVELKGFVRIGKHNIRKAIQEAFNKIGTKEVLLDARGLDLSDQVALEQIIKAEENLVGLWGKPNLVGRVTVITDNHLLIYH